MRREQHAHVVIRRGAYLPHWTKQGATYHVVFRLFDSLPREVVARYVAERQAIAKRAEAMQRPLTQHEANRLAQLHSERIESYLDAGHGACYLKDARLARLVADALRCFDGERYDLIAWAVMPNHVHAVVRPRPGRELPAVLHSWKSFTANEANKILRGRVDRPVTSDQDRNTRAPFWQPEYYDHLIRDTRDFHYCVRYVLENPVRAGLRDWPWVGQGGTGFQPVV